MASLRLKFPDKDEPRVIALSGARVTLGRLPLNTIQIIDRTLSGFHAEFVLEEDHYRLHDRGSTNGTFVNGESVTDFHLHEACKVSFGALECDYRPEPPALAESASVEALPTRSEIDAVREENVALKSRVESLCGQIENNAPPAASPAASPAAVTQAEHDTVIAERDSLKAAQQATEQEIARLKADLALLQRERETLKQVAASAQAEFANFRAEPEPTKEETPPKSEAAAPAAPFIPPAAPAPAIATPLPKPSFPLPAAPRLAPKPPAALPTTPGKLSVAASAPTPPLRILPATPAAVSKGSTQRIDPEAVSPIKPVAPAARLPMKPPVKLPLQPTVKLQSAIRAPTSDGPTTGDQATG